jgi:hypothetical protein
VGLAGGSLRSRPDSRGRSLRSRPDSGGGGVEVLGVDRMVGLAGVVVLGVDRTVGLAGVEVLEADRMVGLAGVEVLGAVNRIMGGGDGLEAFRLDRIVGTRFSGRPQSVLCSW